MSDETSSSNQEGESSNDSKFPSLVIGDGTCQSIMSRGPKKGKKCGEHCAHLQSYCLLHVSVWRVGDGTCQHSMKIGPKKGERGGEPCMHLSSRCIFHGRSERRGRPIDNRLSVLVYGDQYLTVNKHIIIDHDYRIWGVAVGVKRENNIVTAEDEIPPYEMTPEDLNWGIALGLLRPILMKSAGKT